MGKVKIKEGENLQDEIRLMRNYLYSKLKQFEGTLNHLIDFARDDMRRLDKIEEFAKTKQNEGEKK